MNPADFEEKEYEAALYHQLERGDPRIWAPGQVLEQYLGFDRALFLTDIYFWKLHGFHRPQPGLSPFLEIWPYLPRTPSHRNRLPSFLLNLFVQAKRPFIGRRLARHLNALGSHRPFFKFRVDDEQQKCLEATANLLHDRALVVYAAPVFGTSRELFGHTTSGTVVLNSTFPDIASLSGHSAWYYNQAGATGVVNQGYEAVQLPPLSDRMNTLRSRVEIAAEANTPSTQLPSLAAALRSVIREAAGLAEPPRAAYLSQEWDRIAAFTEATDAPPVVTAFLQVDAFARFYNLLWLALGEGAV